MAFKTFAAGAVLTASDLNTYLMNQAVITCTSATRPASPVEGMLIYETDTDKFLTYTGAAWLASGHVGAWTSYTPVISGTGWAIGNGATSGGYSLFGRTCTFYAVVTFGSTSTFGGSALQVTVPVTATVAMGVNGYASDNDTGNNYLLAPRIGSDSFSTATIFCVQSAVGLIQTVISTKPFTWATSDTIVISGTYYTA